MLILFVEFYFLSPIYLKTEDTIEFTIVYMTFLNIILTHMNKWYIKAVLFVFMTLYLQFRGELIKPRPILLFCFVSFIVRQYLDEKQTRLQFYDLFKENKINDNFRNLLKNIMPCGLFVCTKIQETQKLFINFANKKCLEDLQIQKSSQIIQKLNYFTDIKKNIRYNKQF